MAVESPNILIGKDYRGWMSQQDRENLTATYRLRSSQLVSALRDIAQLDGVFPKDRVEHFLHTSIFASAQQYDSLSRSMDILLTHPLELNAYLHEDRTTSSTAAVVMCFTPEQRDGFFEDLHARDLDMTRAFGNKDHNTKFAFFHLSDLLNEEAYITLGILAHELFHYGSRPRVFRGNSEMDEVDRKKIEVLKKEKSWVNFNNIVRVQDGFARFLLADGNIVGMSGYEADDAFAMYVQTLVSARATGTDIDDFVNELLIKAHQHIMMTGGNLFSIRAPLIVSFIHELFGSDIKKALKILMSSERHPLYGIKSHIPGMTVAEGLELIETRNLREIVSRTEEYVQERYRDFLRNS